MCPLTAVSVKLDPHGDADLPLYNDEPDHTKTDGLTEQSVEAVVLDGVLVSVTHEDLKMENK